MSDIFQILSILHIRPEFQACFYDFHITMNCKRIIIIWIFEIDINIWIFEIDMFYRSTIRLNLWRFHSSPSHSLTKSIYEHNTKLEEEKTYLLVDSIF